MRVYPKVVIVLGSIASLVVAPAALAQQAENADVYITATELADEVELIREVMGRPYDDSPRLPAAGITLFELYFQAQTLLHKTNRLAHELAGAELIGEQHVPEGVIDAEQILPLVEQALVEVRRVRTELGIVEPVVRQRRETAIAPTGVFSVILDTNRQLDLLLDEPIRSADVFAATSLALGYVTAILAARGDDPALPDTPFESFRRPADVYGRLMECVDVVADIASAVGIDVASLSSRRNVPDDIEPGHVYDVAQILVADLILLARAFDVEGAEAPVGPAPKHVFPSHAHQRAGALQVQLERLRASF